MVDFFFLLREEIFDGYEEPDDANLRRCPQHRGAAASAESRELRSADAPAASCMAIGMDGGVGTSVGLRRIFRGKSAMLTRRKRNGE